MYDENSIQLRLNWNVVSVHQLKDVATEIVQKSEEIKIFTFTGDLGAGKTSLIKAICEVLGVKEIVSSPTFSIVNEYRLINDEPVYHFDFYRLNAVKQLHEIGIDEYLFSGSYCLIEWPEILANMLPERHCAISLVINGADRDIEMRINK